MKYLKTFEDNNLKKFKKNDIVTCVDSNDDFFGKIGIITHVSPLGNKPYCDVLFVGELDAYLTHNRQIRLASKKEIKQYELEKETNKYNL